MRADHTRWTVTALVVSAVLCVVAIGVLAAASTPQRSAAQAAANTTPTATPTASASASPTPQASEGAAPLESINTSSPVIVTIGDSIMAGFGLDAGEDWPSLLGAAHNVPVTNLACSGAGFLAIGDCGLTFGGIVAAGAAGAEPTIVIVESSDNDMDEDTADIDVATSATIEAVHAAFPRALVVGINTLWNQPSEAPIEIAESSQALAQSVRSVGGVYIDIGNPLRGRTELLQSDDEHPTLQGQQVLLQTITGALAGVGVIV